MVSRRLLLGLAITNAAARPALGTTAADLCSPTADPCVVDRTITVTPDSTLDLGARTLVVAPSGRLAITAGTLTITAGSFVVKPGGDVLGRVDGDYGANVEVTTSGPILLQAAGTSNSRLDVSANLLPGEIRLLAGGPVQVDGLLAAHATSADGLGGTIELSGSSVTVGSAPDLHGGGLGTGGLLLVRSTGSCTIEKTVDVAGGTGGFADVECDGDVTAAGVDADATAASGDGGSVTLAAGGSLVVRGAITARATGTAALGGGTGGDVLLSAYRGSVSLLDVVAANGAAPDGQGGTVEADAGGDLVQSAEIDAVGNGVDGCGGSIATSAGGRLTLAAQHVPGGSCGGGSISADAQGPLLVPAELDADGSGGGGTIALGSRATLTVGARVHANGGDASTTGGANVLTACTVNVGSAAQVQANGVDGSNLVQAGQAMTVAGTITAAPDGTNELDYRAAPPTQTGTVSPLPLVVQVPDLDTCSGVENAACGNGLVETGEECDDGNRTACDGCSPSCLAERCGNGRVECDEACDDGGANGTPGDGCDAACRPTVAATFLYRPGGNTGRVACLLEWALQNPNGPQTNGFPKATQTCIDGDPSCDLDGAIDGGCTFRLAACLARTDPRLPSCHPNGITSLNLARPNPLSSTDPVDVANAALLKNALAAFGTTLTSGSHVLQTGVPRTDHDVCTPTLDVRVPRKGSGEGTRVLVAGAKDPARSLHSNRLRLTCQPNPAVCGNRVVELGEQCDDGNGAACDGCSSGCRLEACGNGVVECGEDCDDGAANGTPGAACSASCTKLAPPVRIPGGGPAKSDCVAEWSIATGAVAVGKKNLPATVQTCRDGDPSCDFDPTPGTCRFHVWLCLGAADERLQCPARAAARVEVTRPTSAQTGPAAAARHGLLAALAALALPAGPGETCTGRVAVDVPAGRSKLSLKTTVTTTDRVADRDTLQLGCTPASAAPRRRALRRW